MERDPERDLDRDPAVPEVRDAAEEGAGAPEPEANVSALSAGRKLLTSWGLLATPRLVQSAGLP